MVCMHGNPKRWRITSSPAARCLAFGHTLCRRLTVHPRALRVLQHHSHIRSRARNQSHSPVPLLLARRAPTTRFCPTLHRHSGVATHMRMRSSTTTPITSQVLMTWPRRRCRRPRRCASPFTHQSHITNGLTTVRSRTPGRPLRPPCRSLLDIPSEAAYGRRFDHRGHLRFPPHIGHLHIGLSLPCFPHTSHPARTPLHNAPLH